MQEQQLPDEILAGQPSLAMGAVERPALSGEQAEDLLDIPAFHSRMPVELVRFAQRRAGGADCLIWLGGDVGSVCARTTCATSLGLPSVTVPVLSRATTLILRASSRYTPPLIRMPRRAAADRPLTTVTGVEMTRAQGQPITSSTSAL